MAYAIFNALAPIFFVLLLGYYAGWKKIIDNKNVASLNGLVMTFALPCSLFVTMASTPRNILLEQGSLFVILSVAMLAPYFLWYFIQRAHGKLTPSQNAVESLVVALPNYAACGLPIVGSILGSQFEVQVSVAIAAGSIIPSPLTLTLLELFKDHPSNAPTQSNFARARTALLRAWSKPIVIAPLIGAALALSGFHLDKAAIGSFHLIGMAAGGCALFLTGLIVSAQTFVLDKRVMIATLIANIAQPLLAALIGYMIGAAPETLKLSILLAALPSGFFGVLFGASYNVPPTEGGAILISSTVFSIVTLAAAIAILYP